MGQIMVEPVKEFETDADGQKQAGQKKLRRPAPGGFGEKGDKNQGQAQLKGNSAQEKFHRLEQRLNRPAGEVMQRTKQINKGETEQAQITLHGAIFRFFPLIGNFIHDF